VYAHLSITQLKKQLMIKKPAHRPLAGPALELIAARFRALGEPSRLKLIIALETGEKTVTELVQATGLTQANASRHLQSLTHAGVLGRRKAGLSVIYSIADPTIFDLCDHVCGSVQERLTKHAQALGARARRAK
jgi:DNA-binding transcriptional ArsR family regulator